LGKVFGTQLGGFLSPLHFYRKIVMKNLSATLLSSFALGALISACGNTSEIEKSLVNQKDIRPNDRLNIVNGKIHDENPAPSAIAKSTVAITFEELLSKKASFCSGTLIRKNVVLTAAHCFTAETRNGSGTDAGDAGVVVQLGGHVPESESVVRVKSHVRHERYDHALTVDPSRNVTPSNDIALVLLETNVPSSFSPINLAPVSGSGSTEQIPSEFMLAGFGLNGEYAKDAAGNPLKGKFGDFIMKETTGILRYVGVKLDSNYNQGKVFSVVGSSGSLPQGACQGDSGGPAFAKNSQGKWEVYGVLSTGETRPVDSNGDGKADFGCNGRTTYTDARDYSDWINTQLATWNAL
jgi:secreted trypsin-like serine protease